MPTLGWLLWAGCAGDGVAERLGAPDVLTDFGLRTLSDRHPAFVAHCYPRGSVWPFDSWLPEPIAFANRVQAWTVGARWALEHGWDARRT